MWAATAHRQSTRRARRVIATYRLRGGPQFDDRRQALEVAQTLAGYHTGPVGEGGWLQALGKASHVLCVHGGGNDLNPRLFEALWMGALPIVKRSPVREVALAPYPIVWIDSWEDLRTLDLAGTEALEARARAVDECARRTRSTSWAAWASRPSTEASSTCGARGTSTARRPRRPRTVPSWSGATAARSRRSGTLRRFRESPRSRAATTSRRFVVSWFMSVRLSSKAFH